MKTTLDLDDTERFQLQIPIVEGTAPPAVEVMDRRALYDFLDEPD